ncbi:arrestin homolog [Pollicipes pollicipes]|uniref:arrestin homolog n=1 Tax=Pollicipes pollicipes TaxID=41117 RepID=UPI0018858195|nr:arrestin homolog [Pollicipes pollicipes]
MVVAVKVFKKSSPNGKLTVYLGRRDFVDHLDHTDPVDGVIVVEDGYIKNRKVYGTVVVTYRYGREEDEVMGLNFAKEMVLLKDQIYPQANTGELTELQDRLLKKLGPNAFPFKFQLPGLAPCSVTLLPGDPTTGKPLGVGYEMKCYVADTDEEKPHKRSSVAMVVRKVQYAQQDRQAKQPSTLVTKGFTLSSGKLNLEVNLDRDVFYHLDQVDAHININNSSRKQVKNIKAQIVQHCEVTMVNKHFTRVVAEMETREGCPITPGASLSKTFHLTPMAKNSMDRGVALDGQLKDADVNLASSTLVASDKGSSDALGVVISYSMRVRLNCGALGGELIADLPFKLLHPAPGSEQQQQQRANQKSQAMDSQPKAAKGDDIVFEEFSKLRRGKSVDDL